MRRGLTTSQCRQAVLQCSASWKPHTKANGKKMCSDAGIGGHKTNHSLRATGATEFFKRGAPEKLIQEQTGHRSLKALRTYERLCEEQYKAISTLISTPGPSPSHLPHCSHIVNTSTSTKT